MKIGLFFGSFNPIHIGHLAIANYMVEFTDIEEIWFVVSPHNPLKDKSILLDDRQRLKMTTLAIEGDRRFQVSDIEFHMPLPSYSINTLNLLKIEYPERNFSIIMGSDGLELFEKWKDYKQIIDTYTRYIYPRPDTSHLLLQNTENSVFVQAPLMEISSTFIRESISQQKDIRHFVPSKVWDYISEMGFYR